MKKAEVGATILGIGVLLGCYALYLDTSVTVNNTSTIISELPNKVENIGLLTQKLCLIIVSGFICISGLMLMVTPDEKERSMSLSHIKAQTKILSLIAIEMEVDENNINLVVQEIGDSNPMLFAKDADSNINESVN